MRFCWANWLFLMVIVVLSLSSILTGCGKTGDLYLPEQSPQSNKEQG